MLGVVFSSTAPAAGAAAPPDKKSDDSGKMDGAKFEPFKSESSTTAGSVTVNGQAITYQAVTGTLVVHPKDWDDVPRDPKTDKPGMPAEDGGEPKNLNPSRM